MSRRSWVSIDQGRPSSQSRYVRITPLSADIGDIFSSRSISLATRSATSLGRSWSFIFWRYSSASEVRSSFSPSSCWIAFICSRRKYSFCVFSICLRTRPLIFFSISRISISRLTMSVSKPRRFSMSTAASSSCLSSSFSGRCPRIRSLRRSGSSTAITVTNVSGGIFLLSFAHCSNWRASRRACASSSGVLRVATSRNSSTSTSKYGSSFR